jgi:hypothetical protein
MHNKYKAMIAIIALAASSAALAEETRTLGDIATNINNSFSFVPTMLEVLAATAGFCLGISALLKLKANRENPHQVSLAVPIAYFSAAVCLISLPLFIGGGLSTLFGDKIGALTAAPVCKGQSCADK